MLLQYGVNFGKILTVFSHKNIKLSIYLNTIRSSIYSTFIDKQPCLTPFSFNLGFVFVSNTIVLTSSPRFTLPLFCSPGELALQLISTSRNFPMINSIRIEYFSRSDTCVIFPFFHLSSSILLTAYISVWFS
jgi:hypothetical protein